MIKQLKRQCLSALFILLAVDLALLHFTTASPSELTTHLIRRLGNEIEVIKQLNWDEKIFILYRNEKTHQLDVAWYKPNALLFWRYNFDGEHQAAPHAHTNQCQTYQTKDYFIIWGANENLQASTLELILNQETFLENLSNKDYFLYVYNLNGVHPETIYCTFYDEQNKNISPYFFESFFK